MSVNVVYSGGEIQSVELSVGYVCDDDDTYGLITLSKTSHGITLAGDLYNLDIDRGDLKQFFELGLKMITSDE